MLDKILPFIHFYYKNKSFLLSRRKAKKLAFMCIPVDVLLEKYLHANIQLDIHCIVLMNWFLLLGRFAS